MSYRYDDENEQALLETEIEGVEVETEDDTDEEKDGDVEYYELPHSIKARSMIWSVLSLSLSVLSVLLCPFYYVGISLASISIVFSIISRKILGFFDRVSVLGLIIGIVGLVFCIFTMSVDLTGILDKIIK